MIVQALQVLRPRASWSMSGDDYNNLVWTDTVQTKPSKQEVEDKVAELIADYQAKQYQRNRVYPSLGDQLDMLWHAIDNGTLNKTSDFYTAIKAVKDAHPKE
jgi:hypothetical protein